MRILYLCHRIPYPPDKGEKIRAFHQVRALAERHEVDLFTLADDAADLRHRTVLEKFCRKATVVYRNGRTARIRAIPHLVTGRPVTLPCFHSESLREGVRQAIAARSYDRIFVYCSAMAQYLDEAAGIPAVVDFVDVDSDKWRQFARASGFPMSMIYRREARTLRSYERSVALSVASVVVSTEREAQLARELAPRAGIDAIPNGVDVEYFRPDGECPEGKCIVFTGDMAYFPNGEAAGFFARRVLPLVRQRVPDARFLIVGRNPSRAVRALRALAGVEVTGYVPDVRAHLARSAVSVAPFSIAAGIQNKILEAMAYGLPVVATSRAVQGLASEVARAVEVADEAGDLADKVVRLLRNSGAAREKGREGRELVKRCYSWDACLAQLVELVEHPGRPSAEPRSLETGTRIAAGR